jgi:large subunit ribosomal protein L14e
VLIDGPQSVTGVHRQVIGLKRVALSDILVQKLPRGAKQRNILKAWNEQGTLEAWKDTSLAKKLAIKEKRANTTDFDRFNIRVAKKLRNQIVAKKLAGK